MSPSVVRKQIGTYFYYKYSRDGFNREYLIREPASEPYYVYFLATDSQEEMDKKELEAIRTLNEHNEKYHNQ